MKTDAGDPHLTAVAHVPGSLEASSEKSFTGTWIRSPHSTMAWRSSGIRKRHDAVRDLRFTDRSALAASFGFADGEAGALVDDLAFELEFFAGKYGAAEFGFLDGDQERHGGEAVDRDDEPAAGLRHAFDLQHARHQRIAGKVSFENRALFRHAADRIAPCARRRRARRCGRSSGNIRNAWVGAFRA